MGLLQEGVTPVDLTNGTPAVPGSSVVDDSDTIGGESIPDAEVAGHQEQNDKDSVVLAGYTMLFENETTSKQAVKFLRDRSDTPAQAISDYTHQLVNMIDDRAGGGIPEGVILPAAAELVENVSELALAANAFPVDNAVMNRAMQLLVEPLAKDYGATPEQVQEFMGSVDETTQQGIAESQGLIANTQPTAAQTGAAPAAAPEEVI